MHIPAHPDGPITATLLGHTAVAGEILLIPCSHSYLGQLDLTDLEVLHFLQHVDRIDNVVLCQTKAHEAKMHRGRHTTVAKPSKSRLRQSEILRAQNAKYLADTGMHRLDSCFTARTQNNKCSTAENQIKRCTLTVVCGRINTTPRSSQVMVAVSATKMLPSPPIAHLLSSRET